MKYSLAGRFMKNLIRMQQRSQLLAKLSKRKKPRAPLRSGKQSCQGLTLLYL
jgi:hypothetical protein